MIPSSLLGRITLALSTVTVVSLAAACGETTDSGSGNAGGNGSGGSNVGGSSNVGGAGSGGTGGACARALPTDTFSCRVSEDCQKTTPAQTCYAPGQSACSGLGGDQQPSCETDAECALQGVDLLCQPQSYGETMKFCRTKCTDSNPCGPSLSCNVGTGRCEPISCATSACPAETFCDENKICTFQNCNASRECNEGFTCSATTFTCAPTTCTGKAAGECPAQFECNEATQLCVRSSCSCDTQCPSDGYCVAGSCYATPGRCQGGCAAGRPLIDGAGEVLVAALVREAAWT